MVGARTIGPGGHDHEVDDRVSCLEDRIRALVYRALGVPPMLVVHEATCVRLEGHAGHASA